MADEPPRPSSGGFSLSKKYGPLPAWAWGLLGGAVIYAGYRFYEARKGTAATTNGASTSDTSGVDWAPQIAVLQTEIQNLQGHRSHKGGHTTTPTTVPHDNDNDNDDDDGHGTTPTTSTHPTTNHGGKTKKMPNVVGQRANFAIGELKSGYGIRARTVPVRNPRNEYSVTGQTPRAGATVRSGMPAVLRVKVIKRGAA